MHLTTYLVTYSIPYLDSDGTCWDDRYALIMRSVNPSVVLQRLEAPLLLKLDPKIIAAMREEGRIGNDAPTVQQYFSVLITPLEDRNGFFHLPGEELRFCARS